MVTTHDDDSDRMAESIYRSLFPSAHLLTHRAPRPSPADVGVDPIRNKTLQIHACAHKRVSVFTVINPHHWKRPFSSEVVMVSVRLSID